MNLGLLGLPSNERSYGPAHDTQSPEQGGGCRCLPNLLDRLWFSLHQLRFCPPKPIAWNRCGVFSPPRPATLIPNCGWLSPESSCFGTNPRYGPTSRLFVNRFGFSKVNT